MITGRCFCGAIRYEARGTPFNETNCHCTICRRTSGAPFVSWFSVRRTDLCFVSGRPKRFRSSANGTRAFCADCGTPLTCELDAFPDEVDITTCSTDAPEMLAPKDHTRTSSKLPWLRLADGLPGFPESRPYGG